MIRNQFLAAAAQLKSELSECQRQLRLADERGDRQQALAILERMLSLQQQFYLRWRQLPGQTPPPTTEPSDAPSS